MPDLSTVHPMAWVAGAGSIVLFAWVLWRSRESDAAPSIPPAPQRREPGALPQKPLPGRPQVLHPDSRAKEAQRAPALVEISGVAREYVDQAGERVIAVQNASMRVEEGELVAIIGPSGQGKSTLMNLLGGLDQPTRGEVRYKGELLPKQEGEGLRRHRADRVAFVFQELNLVTHLSAEENAAMPLLSRGERRKGALARARQNLERLGLGELGHRRPGQLSGGQKQRVAIARAFTSDAPLILADEPTGSLDPRTAREVMDGFFELSRAEGKTVVFVTHNNSLARRYCDRVLRCTSEGLVELERHALEADEAEADREVAAPGAFDAKQESAPGAKRGPSR